MDFFQEPRAKLIEYGERAADHLPRQIIQPVTICAHPRASSDICVFNLPATEWFRKI